MADEKMPTPETIAAEFFGVEGEVLALRAQCASITLVLVRLLALIPAARHSLLEGSADLRRQAIECVDSSAAALDEREQFLQCFSSQLDIFLEIVSHNSGPPSGPSNFQTDPLPVSG